MARLVKCFLPLALGLPVARWIRSGTIEVSISIIYFKQFLKVLSLSKFK
jgi:hypothetical protein